jgi:undecaprenyl-diphosphatase
LGVEQNLLFNIVLHSATLLAVIAVYRKRLWAMLKKPFCNYNLMLLLSTAVTCGTVLLFRNIIDKVFNFYMLPFAFVFTGVVLLLSFSIRRSGMPNGTVRQSVHACSCTQAAVQGLVQGIAVIPGLSRSGLTITAGQLAGQSRENAADFSFLMLIPIIIASLVYEIISGGDIAGVNISNIIIAFVSAFIAGFAAIKFMLAIIRKIDLRWFSVYLFCLAAILLFFNIRL